MLEEWGAPQSAEVVEFVYEKPRPLHTDFQIIYSALDKRFQPTKEERKKISEFFFGQILSNHDKLVDLALIFTCSDIPVEYQYNFVRQITPKMNIPYPKTKKKVQNEILEKLMDRYKINLEQAAIYYDILPQEEIEKLMIEEGKQKSKRAKK